MTKEIRFTSFNWEQVTSALITGALLELGLKAKSWMNWQIPILTKGEHTNSRIINMEKKNIDNYLKQGGVAVIPGFQGISENGDVTSIGRGGSDATAVAIAKIFNTDTCEIYTDVDGVYSTDPKKFLLLRKLKRFHMRNARTFIIRRKSNAAFCCANCYDV